MHYLHKILVYIPNAISESESFESEKELISAVRDYAETATEEFCNVAFDWRDTESAGRWRLNYPVNVLLGQNDANKLISELNEVAECQRAEIQAKLTCLKELVGTDLEAIINAIGSMEEACSEDSGALILAPYYLHCIAAHLHGEYRCDSYFYDTYDYTARLYPKTIFSVKEEPEKWALVFFDCHN